MQKQVLMIKDGLPKLKYHLINSDLTTTRSRYGDYRLDVIFTERMSFRCGNPYQEMPRVGFISLGC